MKQVLLDEHGNVVNDVFGNPVNVYTIFILNQQYYLEEQLEEQPQQISHYQKYKATNAPRLWNDIVVIRQRGRYVLCKCGRCGYVYISQSVLAQRGAAT